MGAKQKLLITAVCFFALLAMAAVAAVLMLTNNDPYAKARSTMDPEGNLELREQNNGTVQLSWPVAENADGYLVEILDSKSLENITTLYADGVNSCILSKLPQDKRVTVRINSIGVYQTEEGEAMRLGDVPLEVTGVFTAPTISELVWSLDPDQRSLHFQFDLSDDASCILYEQDAAGNLNQMDTFSAEEKTITFGKGMDCDMPADHETKTFALGAVIRQPRYVYYCAIKNTFSVERAHLLGSALMMNCRHEGQNIYTFTWNDVGAERYVLQQLTADNSGWVNICEFSADQRRSYTTQALKRYSDYQFRVVGYTGETLTENAYVAEPAKIQLTTGSTAIYSTVWPQRDIPVYQDPYKTTVIGTAPGAQAFCVLAVENGLFKVRYGDGFGYLDSGYCMINLTEFMGGLCAYDIANSYSSVFTAHGYGFSGITGNVIAGYENVQLYANDYLVPLLYPVALKLEQAALRAEEAGYRLKIYDAYRPAKATQALYQQVSSLSDRKLPSVTADGKPGSFSGLTYHQMITNYGRYGLTAFLAQGGSRHNQGVALDLTLEDITTGEEVPMQTAMHDLSYFSVTWKNTEKANLLAAVMKDAGFATLSTEWWHFQDDEVRTSLGINTYLYSGVSAQCWMWDGIGWQYRSADGTYFTDCTISIDGVQYSFDRDGYVLSA